MGITLLGVLSFVMIVAAVFFYRAFKQSVHDQCELANFLMEVLTSDKARDFQKACFLEFVIKSKYQNASVLSAMCTSFLMNIAKSRAAQTVPANRDIYWAMSRSPAAFFENGDPSKPR